ncbi:MAG: D-alanyl-D-alanine carboxypeptidase [Clostridia bacterium]|nr:D-alanyl-D-alanine carboxypeptidase [Clostridia bacterium]
MEEKKNPQPTAKKLDTEALLAVFFIFFIIFTVILTLTMVVGTFAGDEPQEEADSSGEGGDDEPPVENPVFVGTALTNPPTQTSATRTIEDISSAYAALVNAETGEIVASKLGDQRFAPASMTKVMALIVACENLSESDLDRKLEYTQEIFDYTSTGAYAGTDPLLSGGAEQYHKYLGDRFKIVDLLYGIGVASSAECTYMICLAVSGSESAFVALMNQKAQEMGLTGTHFDNAIGHESENNYTTARDMAAIMMYAMQSNLIKNILNKKDVYTYQAYYEEDGTEKSYNRQFSSTLKDRYDSYENAFGSSFYMLTATLQGGKTGYLKENGVVNNCLVSWATSDTDGTMYVLVLGCNEKSSAYTMKDVKTIFETFVD